MNWNNPITNPPKAFDDVLLAVRGEKESSEGFRSTEGYYFSTGHPIEAAKVYAWAAMPSCPDLAFFSALKPLRAPRRMNGKR